MKQKISLLLIIIALMVFLSACGGDTAVEDNSSTAVDQASQGSGITVTLDVTSAYGRESIFGGESAMSKGDTVMDLLNQNVEVDSAYGGSFINGINGLVSGYTGSGEEKQDWFYYVNGIISSVGAADYQLMSGDRIWWDYHLWGDTSFTPAVIGCYPQPFLNGFMNDNPGTLILTGQEMEAEGDALAESLSAMGVANVSREDYAAYKLLNSEKITVVIAPWQELAQDEFLSGAQKNRDKTGLFLSLAQDCFISFDAVGAEVASFASGTGAVFATGTGLGDISPVWVVTGTDSEGTKRALNLLLEGQDKIAGQFAVIVDCSGNIISLPDQR